MEKKWKVPIDHWFQHEKCTIEEIVIIDKDVSGIEFIDILTTVAVHTQ